MDFWEVVGLLIAGFVLAAYIVVLIEVVRDVLRDRGLAGWAKAVWLGALVLLPLLTTIVYVVVRGGTFGGASATDEISRAKDMWDSGAIDKAEFDALKMKALS